MPASNDRDRIFQSIRDEIRAMSPSARRSLIESCISSKTIFTPLLLDDYTTEAPSVPSSQPNETPPNVNPQQQEKENGYTVRETDRRAQFATTSVLGTITNMEDSERLALLDDVLLNQIDERNPLKRKLEDEQDTAVSLYLERLSKTTRSKGRIVDCVAEPDTQWKEVRCDPSDRNLLAKQKIRRIVHTKYPTLKEYVCIRCGKVAAERIHDMIKHVAVHSPGKFHCVNHGCSCGRTGAFNRESALRRHLATIAAKSS
ncbi:hypothetical protein JR316_0006322 [Psilocybe cubensis]|uniref:C2H2-type domain-containing protein n=2 Tax=Psilocybe cubensis TaxID=181762 RepID=A0A8H7Y0X5_PSICU|nr:hypothetical protein JR316_0006322 [Psilocybe cubensis]KAH9481795.1 hypothetical protein JR316_0006322 [Psilocybe cubensis]